MPLARRRILAAEDDPCRGKLAGVPGLCPGPRSFLARMKGGNASSGTAPGGEAALSGRNETPRNARAAGPVDLVSAARRGIGPARR
jgi:hypothetical protein